MVNDERGSKRPGRRAALEHKWSRLTAKIVDVLTALPDSIEAVVRSLDYYIGGTSVIPGFRNRSLFAFGLPILIYFFVIYGPAALSAEGGIERRGILAALLLIAAIVVQLAYFLWSKKHWMRWMHWVVISLVGSITLIAGSESAASLGLYRHYYAPAAMLLLLLSVPVAHLLRKLLFSTPSIDAFKEAFQARLLVGTGEEPATSGARFFGAMLVSILRTPLHIVTPVAFFVLFAPAAWVRWGALIGLVLSLLLVATANYEPQRDAFVRFVRNVFFSGGTLIVTLLALVLAVLRIVGVSYVSTVLDASSKLTVFSYLLSTYALLWLHDFWVRQTELDIMGGAQALDPLETTVRRHGGGRLIVETGNSWRERRMYEPAGLLDQIAETAPDASGDALRAKAADVRQIQRVFSTIMMAFLVAVFAGTFFYVRSRPQVPGLEARRVDPGKAPRLVSLADKLKGSQGPVLVLAASGGGTRAALYTAGVLHGVERLGRLDDLVLASGVSGGSAAIAYFAMHRLELVDGSEAPWTAMRETLSAPFIEDVLAGAGELRITGGTRLGELLTESFERRLLASGSNANPRKTVGEVSELGLIFNAALCGEGGASDGAGANRGGLAESAGGFLVVTNLRTGFNHGAPAASGWRLDLPIKVVRDPAAPLCNAASLSANFPPVFPNAAVDLVDGKTRHRIWVTDGGAVENRGIITALLALADALHEIKRESSAPVLLRDVRMIVAEASAFDPEYMSDRGIGAKFGASTQIANALIRELLASVNRRYLELTDRRDAVRLVYLPMPDALRAAGTFGTHWMMPPLVPFGGPVSLQEEQQILELDGVIVRQMIDAMFSRDFSTAYVRNTWPELDAPLILKRLGELPWPKLETECQ